MTRIAPAPATIAAAATNISDSGLAVRGRRRTLRWPLVPAVAVAPLCPDVPAVAAPLRPLVGVPVVCDAPLLPVAVPLVCGTVVLVPVVPTVLDVALVPLAVETPDVPAVPAVAALPLVAPPDCDCVCGLSADPAGEMVVLRFV